MSGAARILMVSSEVESLARTGGLGDVVEALSGSLVSLGANVVVVTPKYRVTRVPAHAHWWSTPVTAPLGRGHSRQMGVLEARLRGGERATMVVDPQLYDRDGLYGDDQGEFVDAGFRFAALSSAALSVAERAWKGAMPDVLHAHDWHAALSIVYAKRVRGAAWSRVPTVLTIHNLAFQGVVPEAEIDYLAIPRDGWEAGWIRHEGKANLMKGAIELADRVTTVSDTYAREIQRPKHGYGLDAHLRWHASKLVGIVNGIDAESFDPATDGALARRYGLADALDGKRACKRSLCEELGLDDTPEAPLFACISRLHWLKGVDLLLAIVPALVERGSRIVFVGAGDPDLESALRAAAARWPGRVATRIAFDPTLARRVFAGADFLVVPSRDEPCGLTQMYAMRYGAVPIVTPVGGLRDTVNDLDVAHGRGTGIVASSADAAALLIACEEGLAVRGDAAALASLVARAMARDSSWATSASRYLSLYGDLTL